MTVFLDDGDVRLHHGDVLDVLQGMPDESVDCVVTSPPYWGLRDYGTGAWEGGDEGCDHVPPPTRYSETSTLKNDGRPNPGAKNYELQTPTPFRDTCRKCGARRVDQQIGLEPTPDQFVNSLVAVFREVRRVLAPHGTCFVNLGDSYIAAQGGRQSGVGEMPAATLQRTNEPRDREDVDTGAWASRDVTAKTTPARGTTDLKPKDLAGIPWMVAFALRADGWWLRSDIVWAKPNPMPESVTDRPTKSHEYVFLLTKQPRYWFDQEAVRERYEDPREGGEGFRWHSERYTQQTGPQNNSAPSGAGPDGRRKTSVQGRDGSEQHRDGERWPNPTGRNVRSVWTIATQPYPEAHFATYPEELVRRCVLAGCPERVCRTCGKASEREIDTTYEATTGSTGVGRMRNADPRDSRTQQVPMPKATKHVETVGWSDCGHNTWRPGTVLDPFVGSGTTCKVARDHGRHSVGIDLNHEYLELAAQRLQQLSLLTSLPAPEPATPLEGAERSATP